MKQHSLSFVLLITTFACQQKRPDSTLFLVDSVAGITPVSLQTTETPGPSPDNFLIIPGRQVGPIEANATEASLIALLGAENVVRDTIYVAEGTYEIGTTLYKNTADQAHILWKDKDRFARPESVLIRPAYDQDNRLLPGTAGPVSQWFTDTKIRPGSSLREVEKQNGQAFTLYGFDWDYGGLSTSWKGGSLANKKGRTAISVGFSLPETMTDSQQKNYELVVGDQEFSSANPAMQQLNPTVHTLTLFFE